jgi:hypothetical protein
VAKKNRTVSSGADVNHRTKILVEVRNYQPRYFATAVAKKSRKLIETPKKDQAHLVADLPTFRIAAASTSNTIKPA